ncbi:alpha/beta fold hydrolase [Alteromonas sp. KUL49]|uniref:S9 family peptidase n=1 Tax=Alteromonas sp. KUL49 TaxID=2480798 RepID=UPI00102EED41|nr:alpha/beta fold hydrolase [Alteromonas sp. KUL49]TAP39415.1 S9 family peptidase [Alteromonas sp. KUL49]GEA12212.1 peptidase S9 family protein [Alteromonas sp. KUL49]
MKKLGLLSLMVLFSSASLADVVTRTANNGNLVMEDVPEIPQQIVEELNRYQNVRSAPFRGFTASAESIYVSTRFGDVSQIHRVDMAGGARHQLTFFEEPVGGVNRRPNSDNLAFTMDAGGSEYAQIFILDTQSGESTMLTDGQSRNGAMVWNEDGTLLAFQSTRRNGSSNDIWMMSPESPEEASIALESTDGSWWGPVSFSEDNKYLIAQQYISASDSRIYLVDLASKEKTLLAGGGDTPSVNFGLSFSGDDKGLFFITNQYSEFNQLAYKTFDSDDVTIVTEDINWNVDEFAISNAGDRAVFALNEDGLNVLYLLDTKTFAYEKVQGLPVGLVGSLEFSDDDSKLGLTLNTAQSPSDSFVLALNDNPLKHGDMTRWTFSEVGGLDTSTFSEPELIRFESFDERSIPAFVYKPNKEGKLPVIISIHGGPESQFRPAFRSTFQLWMDKLGAAVIAPNVRGSSGYGKEYINLDNGFKREDSVKDIGALLDWIKTQPDLDENRVAVFGGSYGGYMVLASAVHYSDRLKAAVDIVGISNFVTFLENTKSYRRDLRRVEYGDERDPAMREHLEAISPNNNVEKINVPMFVVQGENDPRVPVTEAVQIVEALRENGKPVWYMNALNEGHGYRKKENRDIYTQAVVLFLKSFCNDYF